MTTKLLSALAVVFVASVPVPVFAAPIFEEFSLAIGDSVLDLSPGQPNSPPPVTSGTVTSVNIAKTYVVGGNTYRITPLSSTSNARIFGNDSSLDQISLTNSVITFIAGNPAANLEITYGFVFPLPANTQTYGIQAGGTFNPVTTGDSINATSSPLFSCGEFCNTGPANPLTTGTFVVGTPNFGPLPPPNGVTRQFSCSTSGGVGCTSPGVDYLYETILTLHFNRLGDAVRISNSIDAVSAPCESDTSCDAADRAVQAQLNELAAADAAAVPEPNVILLLLGSGLAGIGLNRLKHAWPRLAQHRHG